MVAESKERGSKELPTWFQLYKFVLSLCKDFGVTKQRALEILGIPLSYDLVGWFKGKGARRVYEPSISHPYDLEAGLRPYFMGEKEIPAPSDVSTNITWQDDVRYAKCMEFSAEAGPVYVHPDFPIPELFLEADKELGISWTDIGVVKPKPGQTMEEAMDAYIREKVPSIPKDAKLHLVEFRYLGGGVNYGSQEKERYLIL